MADHSGIAAWRLRWLSSWRHFRAHPAQLILGIVGVSVGVAAVVAVAAARQAVADSFSRNLQILQGVATHSILARQGEISLEYYRQLRRDFPVIDMAPLVRERARLDESGRRVVVLGMDVIAEAAFSQAGLDSRELLSTNETIDMAAWLGGEPLALAAPALVDDSDSDTLELRWREQRVEVTLAGRLRPDNTLADNVVIMDIALASRLFQRQGIDSVRLRLDAQQASLIDAGLPAELELRSADSDQSGLGAAFSLNLLAMGLLALLMGVLIVFSTFRLLLLQRQPLVRLRHALGSSPAAQAGDALWEALLLGVLGTLAGLLGGLLLAQVVIGWLQQTLSDLWVSGFGSGIHLTPAMLLLGALAGIGGSLLAVAPLVWRVYRSGYLQTRAAAGQRYLLVLGGLSLLILGGSLLFGNQRLLLALAGLFAATMGYLLLSVPLLGWMAAGIRRGFDWQRLLGVLAARRLQASLGHTGPALVALVLAVASIVGIGSMVNSFRASVSDWMDISLSAPLYLGAEGQPLPASLTQQIAAWPEVDAVGWLNTLDARLADYRIELSIIDLPEQGQQSYRMLDGQSLWRSDGDEHLQVMVGETLAARRGIRTGQDISISVPAWQTELTARVSGIFQDYRAGPGRLAVLRSALTSPPPAPTAIGVYPRSDADEALARIRQRLDAVPDLPAAANWFEAAEIKAETLRIFDQTFVLTNALRWIVALVALVGITGALLALQLERRAELQLLQRFGLGRRGQRRLMLYEAGLLGVVAVLLALPLGAALAWMLCEVINQRAFGWHIAVRWLPEHYLLATAVGLLATGLAGWLCVRISDGEASAAQPDWTVRA